MLDAGLAISSLERLLWSTPIPFYPLPLHRVAGRTRAKRNRQPRTTGVRVLLPLLAAHPPTHPHHTAPPLAAPRSFLRPRQKRVGASIPLLLEERFAGIVIWRCRTPHWHTNLDPQFRGPFSAASRLAVAAAAAAQPGHSHPQRGVAVRNRGGERGFVSDAMYHPRPSPAFLPAKGYARVNILPHPADITAAAASRY